MKANIRFWEYVILSGKKIEPSTDEEEANYEIAEYYISRKNNIAA